MLRERSTAVGSTTARRRSEPPVNSVPRWYQRGRSALCLGTGRHEHQRFSAAARRSGSGSPHEVFGEKWRHLVTRASGQLAVGCHSAGGRRLLARVTEPSAYTGAGGARYSPARSRGPRNVTTIIPTEKTKPAHKPAPKSWGGRAGQSHGVVSAGPCQSLYKPNRPMSM